jgi:hypothetical protein
LVCSTVPVRPNTGRCETAKRRANVSRQIRITAGGVGNARAARQAASSARNPATVAVRPNRAINAAAAGMCSNASSDGSGLVESGMAAPC